MLINKRGEMFREFVETSYGLGSNPMLVQGAGGNTSFGLDEYFDYVVTSEESGADKPNPLCFEVALAKIGLPISSEIWMIGDNYESDIIGASCFNIKTVYKGKKQSFSKGRPDIVFDSFQSLAKLYQSLQT